MEKKITIKTLEEDTESLVRHRNRAGIDTSSEKMVSYEQEEPVTEVAKALCEEKTAQNATGYDTRHRPRGTLAAGLGQRPNRRGESLRQAPASSARKQLTDKQIDAVCERLTRAYEAIDEAMKMAFALAKDGDRRMFQIRGAFGGIREKSERADGFLYGLRDMMENESGNR